MIVLPHLAHRQSTFAGLEPSPSTARFRLPPRDISSDLTPQPDSNPLPTILAYLFVISVLLITIPFIVYSVCFKWKNCCAFLRKRKATGSQKAKRGKRGKGRDEEEVLDEMFVFNGTDGPKKSTNATSFLDGQAGILRENVVDVLDLEANLILDSPMVTGRRVVSLPGQGLIAKKENDLGEERKIKKWYEPRNVLRKRSRLVELPRNAVDGRSRRNMTCPLPTTSTTTIERLFRESMSFGSDDSFNGNLPKLRQQFWWKKLLWEGNERMNNEQIVLKNSKIKTRQSSLTPPPRVPYPSISYPLPAARKRDKGKTKLSAFTMSGARDDTPIPLPFPSSCLGSSLGIYSLAQQDSETLESYISFTDTDIDIHPNANTQQNVAPAVLHHEQGPLLATGSLSNTSEIPYNGGIKGKMGKVNQNARDGEDTRAKWYIDEDTEDRSTEVGASLVAASSSWGEIGSTQSAVQTEMKEREPDFMVMNPAPHPDTSVREAIEQTSTLDSTNIDYFYPGVTQPPLDVLRQNRRKKVFPVSPFVAASAKTNKDSERRDKDIFSVILPPFTKYLYNKWKKHNVEIGDVADPLEDWELRRKMCDNSRVRRDRLLRLRSPSVQNTVGKNVEEMSILIKRRFSEPSIGLRRWAEGVWRDALEEVTKGTESRKGDGLLPRPRDIAGHRGNMQPHLPSSFPTWFTFQSCSIISEGSTEIRKSDLRRDRSDVLGSIIEKSDEDVRVVLRRAVKARRAHMKELLREFSERYFLDEVDRRLEWWWGETNPGRLGMGGEVKDGMRDVDAYVFRRPPGGINGGSEIRRSFTEPVRGWTLRVDRREEGEENGDAKREKELSIAIIRTPISASMDDSVDTYDNVKLPLVESNIQGSDCQTESFPEHHSSTANSTNKKLSIPRQKMLLNIPRKRQLVSLSPTSTSLNNMLKLRKRKCFSFSSPSSNENQPVNDRNFSFSLPRGSSRSGLLQERKLSDFINLDPGLAYRVSEGSGYLGDHSDLDSTVRLDCDSLKTGTNHPGNTVDMLDTCSTGVYQLVPKGKSPGIIKFDRRNSVTVEVDGRAEENSVYKETSEWLAGIGFRYDNNENYTSGMRNSWATSTMERKTVGDNFGPDMAKSLSRLTDLILTTTTEAEDLTLLPKHSSSIEFLTKDGKDLDENEYDTFSPVASMRIFNIGSYKDEGQLQQTMIQSLDESGIQTGLKVEKVRGKQKGRRKVRLVEIEMDKSDTSMAELGERNLMEEKLLSSSTDLTVKGTQPIRFFRDQKSTLVHKRAFSAPPVYSLDLTTAAGLDSFSDTSPSYGSTWVSRAGTSRKGAMARERERRTRSEYWDRSIRNGVKRVFGVSLTSSEGGGNIN